MDDNEQRSRINDTHDCNSIVHIHQREFRRLMVSLQLNNAYVTRCLKHNFSKRHQVSLTVNQSTSRLKLDLTARSSFLI